MMKLVNLTDTIFYFVGAFESRAKLMVWAWDKGWYECSDDPETREFYKGCVEHHRRVYCNGRSYA
jgi:hypothetical protein